MNAEPQSSSAAPPADERSIWHDAEHGSYAADLRLWERLAREHPGGVVDLGAGTGRVALHLAACGHQVVAVDTDAGLLAALAERAAERDLDVRTVRCDVRELDLGSTYPLIVAPMQFLHIVGGAAGAPGVPDRDRRPPELRRSLLHGAPRRRLRDR